MTSEIKLASKNALQGKWNQIALVYFVSYLISAFAGAIIGTATSGFGTIAIAVFCTIPLAVGTTRASMAVFRNSEKLEVEMLMTGYKAFTRVLEIGLRKYVIIFLYTLLLIIPGIIKTYTYRFTNLILLDEPELSPKEVLAKSKEMTDGKKFDLFVLDLSFIGWFILAMFTLGIPMIWVTPYIDVAVCTMYHKIRTEKYGEVGVYADSNDMDSSEQTISYIDEDKRKYDDEDSVF